MKTNDQSVTPWTDTEPQDCDMLALSSQGKFQLFGDLRFNRPVQVLLAEDNPGTRLLLADALQDAGCTVEVADDGWQCIRTVDDAKAARTFDVIIIDLYLPGLDGWATARLLRDQGFGGQIIAITATPSWSTRRECVYSGCDAFLAKVNLEHTLIPTVKHLLEKPSPGTQAIQ